MKIEKKLEIFVKTLCPAAVRCGSTKFFVFPISTHVDITVYQHGNVLFIEKDKDKKYKTFPSLK